MHDADPGIFGTEDDGANADGYFDAGSSLLGNVDLRQDAFHIFAVEWSQSCQVFSINGKRYWTNTDKISTAKNHRIVLSVEVDSGEAADGSNGAWNHQVFDFRDNVSPSNPAVALVDWVKVSTKVNDNSLLNNSGQCEL